jgi:nicotinamide-nucleotide amidase
MGIFSQQLIKKTENLIEICKNNHIKIVTAESCTGGMLGALLTSIPGCSQVYDHGFITYSNEAKERLLFVAQKLIMGHGAVSSEVASAMARGVLNNSDANLSVAITGIAGPGGADHKQAGLVYIASCYKPSLEVKVIENKFSGDRAKVRMLSVEVAIDLLFSMAIKREEQVENSII